MKTKEEHINEESIKEMLQGFSKATGFQIDAVNMLGESFIHINENINSNFCKIINSTECGKEKCKKTYKDACNQAIIWKEPYFFRCHAGLIMWAVPIIIDNYSVGSVIGGKILLWEPDDFFFRELKKFNGYINDFEELKEESRKIKVISSQRGQSVAQMLFIIVNYLTKTKNTVFLDEKSKLEWKNKIINQIEEIKEEFSEQVFDYDVYLRREKRLLQYIRMAQQEKVISLLPKIFTDISILSRYDIKEVKRRCLELMSLISRCIVEGGLESNLSIEMVNEFHERISSFTNSDEIFLYLYEVIIKRIDEIYTLGKDKHVSLLKEATDYIQNNYSKDIKINDISSHILISDSYLSHLFKERLNITVNDYVTKVRVEQSIELMKKRNMTIGDITLAVGFISQSHYTKVFKKIIGFTPAYYRNKFL